MAAPLLKDMSEGFVYAEAKRLYRYIPETGQFVRKNPRSKKLKRDASVGKGDGYSRVRIAGRMISAHRIAWLVSYGRWPKNEIDHINGNPADNRLSNLREANRSQNMQNRKAQRKDAPVGVYKRKSGNYAVTIKIDGMQCHVGTYQTLQEALAARKEAKEHLHGFCPVVLRPEEIQGVANGH